MCHHNCHLNHKLPTFISLEHGTVSLIKQTFFPFASTNLWGTPLFVWKQKIQSFLSCDRHCMLGSTWLIQVSIVTLLVGRPCHLSHTRHRNRRQNQNKLKDTQIFKCAGYYPVDLADVFLLKKLYNFCDLHYFGTRRVLCTQKNWLSSYLKMLEK